MFQSIPPLSQLAYQIEEPEEPDEVEDHDSHPFKLRCCAGFPLLRYCSDDLAAAQTMPEVVKLVTKYYSPHLDAAYSSKVEGVTSFKNSNSSTEIRSEGNEAYGMKEYLKALLLYDDSISHAPVNSLELAFAYANRSAVLREMGKFHECISDLQRARDCGYPKSLRYKLLLREAQCLRDLGQPKQAIITIHRTLEALASSDLSEEKRKTFQDVILKENRKASQVAEMCKLHNSTELPPLSYGPSNEVPCASSAIGLRYNGTLDRHFVATRDIKIGDVLIVEKPYVVKPYDIDDQEINCCTHCQKICFTLLPCPNCTWAMFCSEQCLSEANEQYHLVECPIFSKFIYLEDDTLQPVVLVLRCIAKLGLENINQFLEMPENLLDTSEAKRTKGFNADGKYDSSDFQTILNLKSSFSKQSPYHKLSYCMMALELAKCFNPSTYLYYPKFTALLYQLLDQFLINTIAMRYLTFNPGGCGVCITGIGGAIYPTVSLINHSCHANTSTHFYGNNLVCRAIYPISRGQQVTRLFVGPWESCDKITRHEKLQFSFIFDCQCEACNKNWPCMRDLQYLPPSQIKQLKAKSDIVCKLGQLKDSKFGLVLPNPMLFRTVQSLLNDKKALVEHVETTICETSEMLDVLYKHKKIVNSDFVRYKLQLIYLFDFLATTGSNWKK